MFLCYWIIQLLAWLDLKTSVTKYQAYKLHHPHSQELLAAAEVERCKQWGTYRGNLYFEMRTRAPHSVLTGLMWFSHEFKGKPKIRHYCSLDDGLDTWGWKIHDGERYGEQTIKDTENNLVLDISFAIGNSDCWEAKIKVSPIEASKPLNVSIVYYAADEHLDGTLEYRENKRQNCIKFAGRNKVNGKYMFSLHTDQVEETFAYSLKAPSETIWDASAIYSQLMQTDKKHTADSNFVASGNHFIRSGQLSIAFNGGKMALSQMRNGKRTFLLRFVKTFKNLPSSARNACIYALSNLLGSISYFYGTSFVLYETDTDKRVHETDPFELFTDIPSRATFPRGFLWDSGFHNLILSEWSPKLSLEILQSWANRIEHNGWIAREQVPGSEARRAVPVDYIIQNTKHANPPAFLMTLIKLARKMRTNPNELEKKSMIHQLRHIVPQFEKNIKWLARTQRGQLHPHFCKLMKDKQSCHKTLKTPAFRWRGRSKYHNLNSGLDDYPRGKFPNKYELHLDLACWVAFGAKSLLELYSLLEIQGFVKQRKNLVHLYRKVRGSIDSLHWDGERELYSDLTISDDGDLMYVQHQGYVNLFPLFFGFIKIDSPRLESTLNMIEDPSRLWTEFGLRSLSLSDSYYMQGDQYWTGPIWININYLVLAALHNHYLDADGPYYEQVRRIYDNLRRNIIKNMVHSFKETGTIWEQYSDVDGHGMRSHPFTGWSALLILIASEHY